MEQVVQVAWAALAAQFVVGRAGVEVLMAEAVVQWEDRVGLPIDHAARRRESAARVAQRVGLGEREAVGKQPRVGMRSRGKPAARAGVLLVANQAEWGGTLVRWADLALRGSCQTPTPSDTTSSLPVVAAEEAEAHPFSDASHHAAVVEEEAPRQLSPLHPYSQACSRFHQGHGQAAETQTPPHQMCLALQ